MLATASTSCHAAPVERARSAVLRTGRRQAAEPNDELRRSVVALRQRLVDHNEGAGSSRRICRVALLAEPPSIDRGETTDKGYINQRAVLEHRADVVERLYRDDPPPDIVIIE
jgi:feruloyl-CoA synthase